MASLCIRSGFTALRSIARFFHIPHPDDPAPGRPDQHHAASEWEEACRELEAAGVPLRADRDQAWRDFAGWRVNYDIPLVTLAGLLVAPYAPWSSDRSIPFKVRMHPPRRRTERRRLGCGPVGGTGSSASARPTSSGSRSGRLGPLAVDDPREEAVDGARPRCRCGWSRRRRTRATRRAPRRRAPARRETARSRSTNRRAWLTGARLSWVPWITKNGGASARTWLIGDASSNAAAVLVGRRLHDPAGRAAAPPGRSRRGRRRGRGSRRRRRRGRTRRPTCRPTRSRAGTRGSFAVSADHRGEVAAGRAAGDADEVGVAAVLGDVLAHPGERALAVDEVLGPGGPRAQPVVDRDAHPALGGEVQHERQALLALVADDPGAAVDLEQHRRRAARRRSRVARAGRRRAGCAGRSGPYSRFLIRSTRRSRRRKGNTAVRHCGLAQVVGRVEADAVGQRGVEDQARAARHRG